MPLLMALIVFCPMMICPDAFATKLRYDRSPLGQSIPGKFVSLLWEKDLQIHRAYQTSEINHWRERSTPAQLRLPSGYAWLVISGKKAIWGFKKVANPRCDLAVPQQ